jgi:hypothetical protein
MIRGTFREALAHTLRSAETLGRFLILVRGRIGRKWSRSVKGRSEESERAWFLALACGDAVAQFEICWEECVRCCVEADEGWALGIASHELTVVLPSRCGHCELVFPPGSYAGIACAPFRSGEIAGDAGHAELTHDVVGRSTEGIFLPR